MAKIYSIVGSQIYDSRGAPTLEVTLTLDDGTTARSSVAGGASVGRYEVKKIDNFELVFHSISSLIGPALAGKQAADQRAIDQLLVNLDGTADKSNLGGNTILGVSLALARAAAQSLKLPLYYYLATLYHSDKKPKLGFPTPLFSLIEGGRHADNNLTFQDFMIEPKGKRSFRDTMVIALKIFETLRSSLHRIGKSTAVGQEGGFAPELNANEEAIELLVNAVIDAGFTPREEAAIGIDVAAGAIQDLASATYPYPPLQYYQKLAEHYPISVLEDPFPEDDWDNWTALTKKLGTMAVVVGDDLYSTNLGRLRQGIALQASNAVSIEPSEIGTVTETLEAVREARTHGMEVVVSQRAGETEDTFVADLAVGVAAKYFKGGAPNRGERIAKYNQLLRIEKALGL